MKYAEQIEKYTAEITTYLAEYSSKEEPKSIREISDVLNLDTAAVGAVIHELLATNHISTTTSVAHDGLRYYARTPNK